MQMDNIHQCSPGCSILSCIQFAMFSEESHLKQVHDAIKVEVEAVVQSSAKLSVGSLRTYAEEFNARISAKVSAFVS